MQQTETEMSARGSAVRQAKDLFRAHQQAIYRRTDRMFGILMSLQWLAGIAFALWISPKAWEGTSSHIHPHVWAAVLLGGAISFFPVLLALIRPGKTPTRYCIAVGQMLTSALLIHLTGGRIETHFHVFGSLAFLSFYRDWRVLIPATLVVAADHFLRGIFWPQSVYGVLTASQWRWLEHAAWVIFEDIFLIMSCLRSTSEMRDIAKRTAELEASEERYRHLFENNPLPAWVYDLETLNFLAVNEAAVRHYRYSQEEFLRMTFKDIHPAEDAPLLAESDSVVANGRDTVLSPWRHRRKDGSVIDVEITSHALIFDGRRAEIVLANDITERKLAEEKLRTFAAKLEQSNRELQDFASVASHDLQEPLRKVQAFGDRLKVKCGAALTEEGHDYLERMQSAARRMQTLINDLLTFSRVNTKAQPFVPVDLKEVARDVVSDLEVRVERSGGRVEVGELLTIEADPLQMRQLLQNLIANALKFHRADEAPVVKVHGQVAKPECRVEGGSQGHGTYQIFVTDNGIGFDEKYLDRIFTVFQRLHGRHEYEGTGMGLAVCRRIAERHRGSITARSTPGHGTTFVVTLPTQQPKGEHIS